MYAIRSYYEGKQEIVENLLGDQGGVVLVSEIRHEDGEFVPSETGNGIAFANRFDQPRGNFLKQDVSLSTAQRIIDRLEAVQVDNGNTEEKCVAPSPGQFLFDAVPEQVAVGKSGQGA